MEIELIEQASSEIAEYNATEAGLADLRARMANVEYCVTTTAGMAIAKADRAEVRGLRTGLENMRKKIKAPALAHAKLIDEEAKRITAALLELEEPIDAQIKAEEARKETEKAEREAAERARITEIHRRIAELRSYQALAAGCRTSAAIQELIDKLAEIELTCFEEFEDEAKQTRADTMRHMEEAHAQKFSDESDRAQVKAAQDEAAAKLEKDRADIALEDALIKSFDSAARRIEFNNTTYIKKAMLQYESTGGGWENDQRPRVVSAFLAGREYLSERLNVAIDKEEIEKQRAALAAQHAAFAAQQAALAPVVAAQEAIENVANLAQVCEIVQTVDSSKSATDDSEVDPDPVLAWTGVADVLSEQSRRPTDREMLAVLEAAYFVTAPTAFNWLQNINMKALQAELIKEIK